MPIDGAVIQKEPERVGFTAIVFKIRKDLTVFVTIGIVMI